MGLKEPASITQNLKCWTNTEVNLPWVSMMDPNRWMVFMYGYDLLS